MNWRVEVSRCQIGKNLQNYVDKKKRCFYSGYIMGRIQDPELYLQSRLQYQTMLFNRRRI